MPMDICSHIGLSATVRSTHGVLKPLSVDELSVDVTKLLNIQDAIEEDSSSSKPHSSSDFQKKDLCDESLQGKIVTQSPKKCPNMHPLSSGKTLCHQDVTTSELSKNGDNIKSNDPSSSSSISLPTHLKPVSAMKGSREKRGATPPVKLTVKWASDVYDPIPTSVSHVVTNRSSSKHSKKNSKNKQKHGSKSSRGSKNKDKKPVRKRGGNSSSSSGMSYKYEHEEDFVDFHEHEHQTAGVDFHVGNPDQLCGSSFMKRYGMSLHISSVAEAT